MKVKFFILLFAIFSLIFSFTGKESYAEIILPGNLIIAEASGINIVRVTCDGVDYVIILDGVQIIGVYSEG